MTTRLRRPAPEPHLILYTARKVFLVATQGSLPLRPVSFSLHTPSPSGPFPRCPAFCKCAFQVFARFPGGRPSAAERLEFVFIKKTAFREPGFCDNQIAATCTGKGCGGMPERTGHGYILVLLLCEFVHLRKQLSSSHHR